MSTQSQLSDDDDNMGDFWRDIKAHSKKKRSDNRASSKDLLKQRGVKFVSKNLGAHLIVYKHDEIINFWPGTGLWMVQGSKKRHGGVFKLIAYVNGKEERDVRASSSAPTATEPCGSGGNLHGGGGTSRDDTEHWDAEAPFGLGEHSGPSPSDRESGQAPDGEPANG